MISEIWLIFDNSGTENRDLTQKTHFTGPISRARDTVKKEGPCPAINSAS